jgi:hypothetical protein
MRRERKTKSKVPVTLERAKLKPTQGIPYTQEALCNLEWALIERHGDLFNVCKSLNELDPDSRWHVYTEDKPVSPNTTWWI